MGTSYYIRCKKCYEARDILYDLERYDAGDSLEAEFHLAWGDIDMEEITSWIEKHKDHGGLEFTAN